MGRRSATVALAAMLSFATLATACQPEETCTTLSDKQEEALAQNNLSEWDRLEVERRKLACYGEAQCIIDGYCKP